MRKSNFWAATLFAAIAFTSCSVNDETPDNGNRAVRFTAGIEQTATPPQIAPDGTRASETNWGSSDEIGIFMVESGTTHYANKQYTTPGDGTFTAAAGSEMYYPMNGNPVNFIAYYPYKSGATLASPIGVTIGDQTDQPAFDLLWTTADNSGSGYDKLTNATTPVALAFTHKLAKIVMNTTADQNVGAPLNDMTVKIIGMNTANTFDLSTGALGTATTPADIIPRTVADGTIYDAAILPGSYGAGDVTVEFTLTTGETFTWILPETDFTGGNEYTYTVTLTRTGVQVTGTISPWITNDRGNFDAE